MVRRLIPWFCVALLATAVVGCAGGAAPAADARWGAAVWGVARWAP